MKSIRIDLDNGMGLPFGEMRVKLGKDEYPNIYIDAPITEGDFNNAIDTIITYFMQKDLFCVLVNLERKDYLQSPIEEMTLEEIEKN